MEIATLMAFLSPCLPFLVKLGEKAAETFGSQLGKDVSEEVKGKWEAAQKIWSKLYPKIEEKKDVMRAVEAVAEAPEDEDSQIFLRSKLAKLLEQEPDLVEAIAQILQEEAISGQINIAVKGDNSGVIGGNIKDSKVFGSVDIQGDINM